LIAHEQMLSGSIATALGVRLTRCMLAYGNWAYDLGTLEPGQAVPLGPSTRRSQLRTYLTNPRIVKETGDRYRQETLPYDPSSVDLPYILQAMMFFESGGGSRYTGLVNRYQPFIDLTGTLEAGRAVLVGFAEPSAAVRPGAELCDGGRGLSRPDDTRVVVYRFVLPVKKLVFKQANAFGVWDGCFIGGPGDMASGRRHGGRGEVSDCLVLHGGLGCTSCGSG
jgi:hypothetical protein